MTLMLDPNEQNSAAAIHYDPQKYGRLKDPVIVLRKVNPAKLQHRETPQSSTAWELIGLGQAQLHLKEKRLPWYEQGLIMNDNPRDEKVARDVEKATIGFAIARSDTGEVLKVYGPDALDQAIEDAQGVRLTIKASVQKMVIKEDDDDKLVAEFLASQPEDGIEDATPEPQEA